MVRLQEERFYHCFNLLTSVVLPLKHALYTAQSLWQAILHVIVPYFLIDERLRAGSIRSRQHVTIQTILGGDSFGVIGRAEFKLHPPQMTGCQLDMDLNGLSLAVVTDDDPLAVYPACLVRPWLGISIVVPANAASSAVELMLGLYTNFFCILIFVFGCCLTQY